MGLIVGFCLSITTVVIVTNDTAMTNKGCFIIKNGCFIF
jgi:hypothetical protein